MAVTVLHPTRARSQQAAASLPWVVLVAALTAPAFDLLTLVQPAVDLSGASLLGSAAGAVLLMAMSTRHPRTNWLVAACLAAGSSAVLRMAGFDLAPFLSLLALLALGVGGAFASHVEDADPLLELQPS